MPARMTIVCNGFALFLQKTAQEETDVDSDDKKMDADQYHNN